MKFLKLLFRKTSLLFFAFLFVGKVANAQLSEWSMYNMEPVFQSVYFNPAAKPLNKLSIGLPLISSVGFEFKHTGFKIGDLLNGQLLDINKAIGSMSKTNFISLGTSYDLFHIRMKVRKSYIGFYVQDNINFMHSYPKEFYQLLWEGNVGFQNKTIDLKKYSYDLNYYRSYAFHISHDFKKLRIGANVKYLTGFANLHSDINKFDLSFNDRFETSVDADASIYSAGLFPNDSTKDFDDSDVMEDRIMKQQTLANKNKGFGLDIGATYQLNKKWEFGASMTNLGRITWKEETFRRTMNGDGNFQGFDIANEYLKNEKTNEKSLTKKIENDFKYSTGVGKYSTWLIPRFALQAKYNLSKNTYLANNLFIEKYKTIRFANSLAIYHQFGRVLGASLNATYAYKTINNIGVGVYLKLGPAQLYLSGDNLIGVAFRSMSDGMEINQKVLAPVKVYNVRLGMNLVFGRVTGPSTQTYQFK